MATRTHPRYALTPERQELARWLLQHERTAEAHEKADGPLELTEHVLRRLAPGVTALVTTTGYRALLARALHVTRAQFPFLEGVHVSTGDAFVEGPPVAGGGAIDESFAALIGSLVALLATFIGDDLTNSLIRGAWPDAPLRPAEPGSGGRS
jgi:hypothetical protein